MKKILSIALAVVMLFAVVALAGCSNNEPDDNTDATLKFGMGIVANAEGKDASGGEMNATAIAVLVDAEGKIAAIKLDSAQVKATWDDAGVATATEEIKTKYELGTDYNMAAYGTDMNGDGKVLEWYEQADAFMATAKGKTVDEMKAFVGENGFATGDLATAGCTIGVTDFIKALEKAVANAVESDATANDTLNLAIVSTSAAEDATEDKEGSNELASTITAAVVNAEGKVVVAKTDCVTTTFKYDTEGVVTAGNAEEIKTKAELGNDYNMSAYGTDLNGDGKVLEWYEQAAAFDTALVGKNATEIGALVVNGYGTEEIQTAGCTIAVADMVAAAVKDATVA